MKKKGECTTRGENERGTFNSKINGTPKGVYLPISKLNSILALANLLEHNNLWLCYYVQVNTFESTIYFAVVTVH